MRSHAILKTTLSRRVVMRVIEARNLINEWTPELNFLVMAGGEYGTRQGKGKERTENSDDSAEGVQRLIAAGLSNITHAHKQNCDAATKLPSLTPWVYMPAADTLKPGDVVAVSPHDQLLHVLLREGDVHHALFLTNRCNNNCLMCSQPPTRHDDSWLLEEALEALRHVRNPPAKLGITGGEPLLYGASLRRIFDAAAESLPATKLELLTNGRLLANPVLAKTLLEGLRADVSWLVPLYGHADFLHDFVVQAHGAFDETLSALLNLQAYRQPIQLRVVLIKPVLDILPELCEFIGRNLPFVREVALMACEPIGFALANRDQCEVDLRAQSHAMLNGGRVLDRLGMPYVLMNIPLCALPESLRHRAARSISDWKQTYAQKCEACSQMARCCGLFAWHEKAWAPAPITTITEEVVA